MKITQRIGKAAFTLIEVMAVITIIIILAGLVISGMGFVKDRQAKSKAQVQIALLSKALEEYKLDMGTYPPTADKSTASAPNGTGTSSILFNYLYWDSDNDAAGVGSDDDQKIYLSDLDPVTSKQGWTTKPAGSSTAIVDPWGNQYCYRTATDSTGNANTATQNPDFDLWSMGKDGKTKPANPDDATNRDDIKNF